MAKNFKELQKKMSSQSRARSQAAALEISKALPLAQVREAQNITQEQLAKRLRVDQSAVSKIEHRADMYLSTLRDVVRAMGGELELTVRFPGGEIHVLDLAHSESKEEHVTSTAKR